MLTSLIALLSSGAGGGLFGGIFGLFKQHLERKERVEMARISAEREAAAFAAEAAERAHQLVMLETQGQLQLQAVATEAEAAVDVAQQEALGQAQQVFASLKTTSDMDNFRASVRPALAYAVFVLFALMLGWAFWEFQDTIDEATGRELLLGLFGTLTFLVTSIGTFYYVARRNPAP